MTPRGIQGLVLGAGAASRFGGGKLLAPLDGAPLITWAVRNALRTTIDRCIVVVGAQAEAIGAVVNAIQDPRVEVVVSPDWQDGLSASLRTGLKALPADSRGVLVFLGDMPNVAPQHGDLLAGALMDGATAAELTCRGGPAHPIGFSSSFYPDLAALRGDRGGRHLLEGRSGVSRFTTADVGTIADVDTPADLEALARSEKASPTP